MMVSSRNGSSGCRKYGGMNNLAPFRLSPVQPLPPHWPSASQMPGWPCASLPGGRPSSSRHPSFSWGLVEAVARNERCEVWWAVEVEVLASAAVAASLVQWYQGVPHRYCSGSAARMQWHSECCRSEAVTSVLQWQCRSDAVAFGVLPVGCSDIWSALTADCLLFPNEL